jgi:hypothetical protein
MPWHGVRAPVTAGWQIGAAAGGGAQSDDSGSMSPPALPSGGAGTSTIVQTTASRRREVHQARPRYVAAGFSHIEYTFAVKYSRSGGIRCITAIARTTRLALTFVAK